MPIQDCQQNGKPGYSYGPEGTCYIYNPDSEQSKKNAREKAAKQGRAIEVNKVFKNIKKLFGVERISFDYDGVLSTDSGKSKAKQLISEGNSIYIITARKEKSDNSDLYSTAVELGISKKRIFFTNGKDKWETVKRLRIDVHYDNNPEQIEKINKNTKTKAIKI